MNGDVAVFIIHLQIHVNSHQLPSGTLIKPKAQLSEEFPEWYQSEEEKRISKTSVKKIVIKGRRYGS